MKVRIANLVELVLAVGVGMGLSRAVHRGVPIGSYGIRYVVEPFLGGVAVVGAIVIGFESLRQPGRRPWGIGRWTWMTSGLFAVLYVMVDLILRCLMWWRDGLPLQSLMPPLSGLLSVLFGGQVAWMILAMWTANAISKSLRDPEPDAREFVGRAFSVAIIVWAVVYRALHLTPYRLKL